MTVLLVVPYRLASAGGLRTIVTRLQDTLLARGHRALVLLAGDSNRVEPVPGRPWTFAIRLRQLAPAGAPLRGGMAFVMRLPGSLLALRRFLARERVDVVHVHFPTPGTLYLTAVHPGSRWGLVLTFHGTDGYGLTRASAMHRRLVALAARRADAVTAVSEDLLRAVRRGCPGIRDSRVVRNGNPLTGVASTPPVVLDGLPPTFALGIGSLIRRKAYDVVLRALRIVHEQGTPLPLVLVGNGPQRKELERLAQDLGIADHVIFVGEVDHAQVTAFLRRATIFVHVAREEAFGLVLLEAMSERCPLIAASVGGIVEFVKHEETGLLVPPDDPIGLASAMRRLVGEPALREALAARAYDRLVGEYAWDRMVDEYVSIYQSVVARRSVA